MTVIQADPRRYWLVRLKFSRYLPVAGVLALGLFLRIYHIGVPSFWYDEVCEVQAAITPTVGGAFQIVRQHILAMPLDYLVVWLFAHLGNSEEILRLPAAIWGTLSLLVAYHLFNRLSNRRTTLLTILLMALSPILVRYSQEARYYSSLVFFYLLTTDFLLGAIQSPGFWRWVGVTAIGVVGVYFHPFVLLGFINGFAELVVHGKGDQILKKGWLPFFLSGCVVVVTLGIYYASFTTKFTPVSFEHFELLVTYAFVVGLGWIPQTYIQPGLGWFWGILTFLFAALGIVYAVRSTKSTVKGLIASTIAQISLLVAADFILYFPEPRQYIEIVPLVLFFAAFGVDSFLKTIVRLKRNGQDTLIGKLGVAEYFFGICLIVFGALTSLPALTDYYHSDRSRARELSEILAAEWQPGNVVLVMPDTRARTDSVVYQYYLVERMGRGDFASAIKGTDWDRLEQSTHNNNKLFLITTAPGPSPYLSAEQINALQNLGFKSFPIGPNDGARLQRLWTRG